MKNLKTLAKFLLSDKKMRIITIIMIFFIAGRMYGIERNISKEPITPLVFKATYRAIINNNLKLIKYYTDRSAFDRKYSFNSILHIAAQRKNREAIKILYDSGVSIDELDIKGNTILYFAINSRDLNWIKDLIGYGATINIYNNAGNTPLHYAAQHPDDDPAIAIYLIAQGAELEIKNKVGFTPCDMAELAKNERIYTVLCRR